MPPPLSVDQALARILDGVEPTPVEAVPVEAAHRRTLAEPLAALLTQPPFDASAMDGYAVRGADVARLPATLALIGEAAAGHPFAGAVARGQAVRIFTGAPMPEGADAVVIQENATQDKAGRDGAKVTVREGTPDRPRAPDGLRFPRRRGAAGPRPAPGPARGVARGRHGARHRARAPAPARRCHLHRRRAAAARQPAGAGADHLLQPPWHPRPRRGRGRRDQLHRHRPRHARSLEESFARAAGRTSSSPSAAPRSATTTSSARCCRTEAWRWRSGTSPCGRASR